MNQPCTAQYWAVCHTCRLRHPCWTNQQYLDFAERHPAHHVSLLNRDWLAEQGNDRLAAWDPRKFVRSGAGFLGALWVRLIGGEQIDARHVETLRSRLSLALPQLADVIPKLSLRELFEIAAYSPNANVAETFGTDTAITITLVSLASSATVGREWTAIDNTSNLYLDALLRFHIPILTGSPANDKAIYFFLAASEDGTNYTDNATGADAAITMRDPTNLKPIGVLNCPDSGALTYKTPAFGVAKGNDGILPPKWGGAVRNYTGLAFNATEGNLIKQYRGVAASVV